LTDGLLMEQDKLSLRDECCVIASAYLWLQQHTEQQGGVGHRCWQHSQTPPSPNPQTSSPLHPAIVIRYLRTHVRVAVPSGA